MKCIQFSIDKVFEMEFSLFWFTHIMALYDLTLSVYSEKYFWESFFQTFTEDRAVVEIVKEYAQMNTGFDISKSAVHVSILFTILQCSKTSDARS
nr:hypothetical transcript [Hymenolepis microstoma]